MPKNADRKRLVKYLVFTFLITWIAWWGDALLVKTTSLSASDVLPMILFTVGGFGPTVAACLCLEDGFSLKNLKNFIFRNAKKNWLFIVVAIILETIFFYACSDGLIPSIPKSPIAGIVVLVVFVQATILYGGNEELGWRGTMQPILEKTIPSPVATFLIALVWGCWHIPLWFIEGDSHQNMSFVTFLVLGVALSYWLAAIYDATGAVLFCMMLHGWTNTLMGVFDIKQGAIYYFGLAILTGAAITVSVWGRKKKTVH